MQCYTPMFRYYQVATREQKEKISSKNQKLIQKIVPRNEVLKRLLKDENYFQAVKRINKENEEKGSPWRYQLIPCRHCYACSLNYAADAATKMYFESIYSEQNYFVTLTYDDEHLPIAEKISRIEDGKETILTENDGTWIEGTLSKEDSQAFIKRLREHLRSREALGNFKFYLGAEYGEQGRPHYHVILMDCRLDETQFYDCHIDENHKDHWKSKELERLWPYGIIDIAKAEWSDMAYVARYTAKKWIKSSDPWEYYIKGKIPEYVAMSNNIGKRYFIEHKKEIYETDEIIMQQFQGKPVRCKPPKRYDKLLENEDPQKYDEIKERREKISEMIKENLKETANYTDFEVLRQNENRCTIKASMLKRNMD